MKKRLLVKLGKWLGAASALTGVCFWAYFAYINQFHSETVAPDAWMKTVVMLLISAAGVLAVFQEQPYLMLLVFLLSFFPIGLSLLGVPSIFRVIGISDLAFLLSSVLMLSNREDRQFSLSRSRPR